MKKQPPPASQTPKDEREQRLQAALRANLKRRKQAAAKASPKAEPK